MPRAFCSFLLGSAPSHTLRVVHSVRGSGPFADLSCPPCLGARLLGERADKFPRRKFERPRGEKPGGRRQRGQRDGPTHWRQNPLCPTPGSWRRWPGT